MALLLCIGWMQSPLAKDQSLADLYEQTSPSVVVIHTAESLAPPPGKDQTVSVPGLGSGVVISNDQILTAAHVVHNADSLEIEFLDGTRVPAEVISSEPRADLALLQLYDPYDDARPATLGDSDSVRIGEENYVIGSPLGNAHTLTWGHISARHTPETHMSDFSKSEFFQTDAAINQGNSGGPMFNMDGEVIGIVSHIQSQTGGNVGLGFAVTINTAKELIFNKRSFYSGFESVKIKGPLASALNIGQPSGMLVQRVTTGSFAQRLGLKGGNIPADVAGNKILLGGDVILEISGIQVNDEQSVNDIRNKIDQLEIGDSLEMTILRNGGREKLSAYILI